MTFNEETYLSQLTTESLKNIRTVCRLDLRVAEGKPWNRVLSTREETEARLALVERIMASRTPKLGDITKELEYRGYRILRRVAKIAYARNGNAHNPSVTYAWDIYRGTAPIDFGISRLKDAKAEIDGYDANQLADKLHA